MTFSQGHKSLMGNTVPLDAEDKCGHRGAMFIAGGEGGGSRVHA